ncbi:Crp/Fnr family transcriptional regulator [Rhizobium paranaense]|uniref:CRP/FNR family transcriptional regulator n=1 Tax=Rhizobium paranaense TaxID=1650438 RepID=A0A7W9D350_9HYPH|nr:helix-turn-helix domain-containing protein [Rhizobium paranaense]MBB5575958.1 CRP/FNR family transcriptional regulator [Rhizobium paranaense]
MLANNLHLVPNIIDGAVTASDAVSLGIIFKKQPLERATAGQILFFEGDAAKHLFSIVEGNLRICRLLSDGRRVITGFLKNGDVVGVSFKSRYLYSAEVIDEVVFQRMTKRSFEEELTVLPQLRSLVLSRLRDEVAAAQDQMVLLSCKSAEERLASFLLKQLRHGEAQGGPRGMVSLPMTRHDIGDYLGLTTETVSRTVTKLSGRRLIAVCGRNAIQVLNETALAHQAGEGEDYDDLGKAVGQYRH